MWAKLDSAIKLHVTLKFFLYKLLTFSTAALILLSKYFFKDARPTDLAAILAEGLYTDTVINVVTNAGIFRYSQFSTEYGKIFK